jgi:hypothetical protein
MKKFNTVAQFKSSASKFGAAALASLALSACGPLPQALQSNLSNAPNSVAPSYVNGFPTCPSGYVFNNNACLLSGATAMPASTVPSYVNGVASCPAGYTLAGSMCNITTSVGAVDPQFFQSNCQMRGGQIVSGANNSQLCRVTIDYGSRVFTASNGVPRITPSSASSQGIGYLGIELMPNDRLTYRGTGGWSETGGSLFFATSSRCHDTTNTGWDGSQIVQNEGMPAGLVASDGTNVYFLGENSTVTIKARGSLRLGFNSRMVSYGCHQLDVNYLAITRCTDAQGNSQACQ